MIKFTHLKDKRLTFAYYRVSSMDILYGVARCHPNDKFEKSTGREVSEQSLRNAPFIIPLERAAYAASLASGELFNPHDVYKLILDGSLTLSDSIVREFIKTDYANIK